MFVMHMQGGQTAGFARSHKNLAEVIVLNAGHMIPSDQPRIGLELLDRILSTRNEAEVSSLQPLSIS